MIFQIAYLARVDLWAQGHTALQHFQSQEITLSGSRRGFELGLDHAGRPKSASVRQEDTNETCLAQGPPSGGYVSPAFVQRTPGYSPQLGEYRSHAAADMRKAETSMSDTMYLVPAGIL